MSPDVPVSPWELLIVGSFIVPWIIFWGLNMWAMCSPEYKNRRIY